jgi:5-methylcytosine-specific restriction protein A
VRRQVLLDAAYACAMCRRITLRLEVDHIAGHADDPARFWDRANLQALCGPCHAAKTRRGA